MSKSKLICGPALGRTILAGSMILGAAFIAQPAMACTLDNWSNSSGAIIANNPQGSDGDPAGNTTAVARYSGFCAARATGGTGWVQDNRPGGINRIVARFYVLNQLASGSPVIYEGYSSTTGSGPLFRVTKSSAGTVTLTDVATGQSVNQSSDTPWASVEVDFGQGAGSGFISLSVNGQNPSEVDGLSNAGSALESVRLGNISGASSGALNFDSYESRRSTAVGRLCAGDANIDGVRDFEDLTMVFTEVQGGNLAHGQPDMDENGQIDFADLSAIFAVIQAGQGEC